MLFGSSMQWLRCGAAAGPTQEPALAGSGRTALEGAEDGATSGFQKELRERGRGGRCLVPNSFLRS